MAFRYFLLALVLAVVWWQAVGAFSAFAAGLGFVMLSFGTQNGLRSLLSLRWPTTEAVVAESRVLASAEARRLVEGGGEAASDAGGVRDPPGYVPLVRYEYTVDGTRYENASVSPFDGSISRRTWAEAIVDDYSPGETVPVRYDPDDPTSSYLRSAVRSSTLVSSSVGFLFLTVAVWIAAGFPGGAPAAAMGVGVPITVIGLNRFRIGRRSRDWPTTPGMVTSTSISTEGGGEDSEAAYVPELQYEYEVEGYSYASSRYGFGTTPTFSARSGARSWIEEHYPEGGEVTVHYDPDRPDRAMLEPGTGRSLMVVAVGLAFTGLGVFMLLTARGGVL